ncbi:MAG: hypothetical protein JNL39_14900 [Opitutaceae bacterium]|nr:hypothetical protein [Opitutaceae bacterium]
MNYPDPMDRVFPLSQGAAERALLRPPRILLPGTVPAPAVLGHGAFMRAWAARRHALAAGAKPAEAPSVAASLG